MQIDQVAKQWDDHLDDLLDEARAAGAYSCTHCLHWASS